MYTDPECKPWTSGRWAPPGYVSRQDLIMRTRGEEEQKQDGFGVVEGSI